MSETTNILWLSDIHFKEKYDQGGHVGGLIFDKLCHYLKNELSDRKIDYVVISGDIAHSGASKEYTSFMRRIAQLDYLKEQGALFMVIPGNHDVNWGKLRNLYDDTKDANPDLTAETFFSYKYMNENRNAASYDILYDFGDKFQRIEDYNQANVCEGVRIEFDAKKLMGYVYDERQKLLFLLINSAMNSYGEVPKSALFGELELRYYKHGVHSTTEQVILYGQHVLQQRGNQTYQLQYFKEHPIPKEILDQDPYIVSVAHHHFDWLHWSERFTFEDDYPAINDIIYKSHLHLVGHEHSRPSRGAYHGKKCLVLRSGMFLDHNVDEGVITHEDKENFPNNFFSIIELSDHQVTHHNYEYKYERINESEMQFVWKASDKFDYDRHLIVQPDPSAPKPNYIRDENGNREISVRLKMDEQDRFRYLDYLREERGITGFERIHTTDWSSDFNAQLYYAEDRQELRFLFLNLDQYYSKQNSFNIRASLIEELDQSIQNASENRAIKVYTICFYDFYEYEIELEKLNEKEKEQALKAASNLYKKRDYLFTSFKHHLFTAFIKEGLLKTLYDANVSYDFLDWEEISQK